MVIALSVPTPPSPHGTTPNMMIVVPYGRYPKMGVESPVRTGGLPDDTTSSTGTAAPLDGQDPRPSASWYGTRHLAQLGFISGDLERQAPPLGEWGSAVLEHCARTTTDSEGATPPPWPTFAEDEWILMGENEWASLGEDHWPISGESPWTSIIRRMTDCRDRLLTTRRDSGVGFMRLLRGVDQITLSLSVRGWQP